MDLSRFLLSLKKRLAFRFEFSCGNCREGENKCRTCFPGEERGEALTPPYNPLSQSAPPADHTHIQRKRHPDLSYFIFDFFRKEKGDDKKENQGKAESTEI